MIVCGDIIKGAPAYADFDSSILEIKQQYNMANDFLNQLCEKIFDGDKNRIVIIPGNHDISWPHSRKSMEKIDKRDKEFKDLSQTPERGIRWSWDDYSFYKIKDLGDYNQRFLLFSEFYSTFYNNARKYSLKPDEQYDIFEFLEYKLLIVGFNSCYFNDHIENVGKINPDCMANCHSLINNEKYGDWLKIAVWHHGIHSFPKKSDFMDEGTVHFLIDKGFQLGLHGHQHKSDIYDIRFNADQKVKMAILGSGTLCASPQDIPAGETRQYNIIEIDGSFDSLRLHIRKTVEQTDGLPIFMPENIRQNNGERYWDIPLKTSKLSTGKINIVEKAKEFSFIQKIVRMIRSKTMKANTRKELKMFDTSDFSKELEEIDSLVAKKEYGRALIKLDPLPLKHPFTRRLKIECFAQLKMDDECIKLIKTPSNIMEFTYITEALWRQKKFSDLRILLDKVSDNHAFVRSEQFNRMDNKLKDKGF